MRWYHVSSILCAAMFIACGSTKTVPLVPGITGTVVSTTGSTVAGAQVTVNGRSVLTNSDGVFMLESAADADTYVGVRVKAAGYPEATRRVLMPTAIQARLQFTLRPIDQSQTFALPTGATPATFSINRGVAGAKLSVPSASLVDVQGNPAAGNANMNLTFWSPDDDMSTIPGILRASDSNHQPRDDSPITLLSYGMVDISIEQDGNELQVAPGASLALVMQTTAGRRDALASRTSDSSKGPTLWTLNPNTGLWDEDIGDSTYDKTTGELVATLHHLSTKNSDEPFNQSGPLVGNSGCITGRAYGQCGQPLPNAVVTINVSSGPAGDSIPGNLVYTTDSTGSYKENVSPSGHNSYYASAVWNGHFTDMTQSPKDASMVFVSYGGGVTPTYPRSTLVAMTCSDKSGQCQNDACKCFNDPSDPGGCLEALEAADPVNVYGYNPCWANPLGSSWLGPCFDDALTGSPIDAHYNTVWENRTLGTLCSNCWPILDMVFKDVAGDQSPNCTGVGATGTGCCPKTPPPGTYSVCNDAASPHRKFLGDLCSTASDTCCGAQGAFGLVCADNLCVPNTDPE